MADVRDGDGVVASLLKAMRIAVPPGVPAERVLASYLANRDALLLLDNSERLVEAVGSALVDLLAAAPGLRVLVTSRAPIGLVGEQRYVVPPMDADGDDTTDSEAVRLFLDRWADRGLTPEPDELRSIGAMCDLVDRLPLGIELAAAAAADSCVEVALSEIRLHHGLLDAAEGSLPAMRGVGDHGGLVAVLSSTTSLLTPAQRELLGRLGVFPDTFDRNAVEAVAGSPSWESDLLRLRDLALVSAQNSPAGRRLRLLDTTAAYARENRADRGHDRRHTNARTALPGARGRDRAFNGRAR